MRSSSQQNVVVMRHGDRLDNLEPTWITHAKRPWDPPLAEAGHVRAFCSGRKLRNDLGFPINRVFVSPFLRCVQTASEVISALCAVDIDPYGTSSASVALDPSKIKVSIEYGLCEMFNRKAIRDESAPKDGKFHFNTSELEAMLPSGTVDSTIERVYKELPKWEETKEAARTRYEQIIKALANKYPSENILLITHGEGVGVSVSAFSKGITVHDVEYCAYSELRRPIVCDDENSITAGDLSVHRKPAWTGKSFRSSLRANGRVEDDHFA